MKPFKTQAHIHSLDGAMDEITVLEEITNGRQTTYIADYGGVKCTAIFNPTRRQPQWNTFKRELGWHLSASQRLVVGVFAPQREICSKSAALKATGILRTKSRGQTGETERNCARAL